MTKFVRLRVKIYSYLINDGSEDKKAKYTKKFAIKEKVKFNYSKNCLQATQFGNEINYLKENRIDIHYLKKVIKNLQ